jgi:hypothetical protein
MSTPTDHDREHAFAELLAAGRSEHGRIYPLKRDVAEFVDGLLGVLFPQLSDDAAASADELAARLVLARRDLRRLVAPLTGEASSTPLARLCRRSTAGSSSTPRRSRPATRPPSPSTR